MIKSIQKEFIELLGPNDWMDQESKTKAKEKVCFIKCRIFCLFFFNKSLFNQKAELIDVKVGYPDFTYNDTYLDIYENVLTGFDEMSIFLF
jgi:predicted metalloendopeptidase